jgi:hypothetical protein
MSRSPPPPVGCTPQRKRLSGGLLAVSGEKGGWVPEMQNAGAEPNGGGRPVSNLAGI